MTQDRVFVASEGNRWFRRNKTALEQFDPRTDPPLTVIRQYDLHPHSVLEIGGANGVRLAAIHDLRAARVVAVEASAEAIRDGRLRFPAVEFVQGEASALPVRGEFDLVIVNFVFHWIDRRNLLRTVAEVDRVLADEGFLIVGDFYPSAATRVRYHHLPERDIHTYKQDYAAVFVASQLYRPVCLLTGTHAPSTSSGGGDEANRTGVWLLQKTRTKLYREQPPRSP